MTAQSRLLISQNRFRQCGFSKSSNQAGFMIFQDLAREYIIEDFTLQVCLNRLEKAFHNCLLIAFLRLYHYVKRDFDQSSHDCKVKMIVSAFGLKASSGVEYDNPSGPGVSTWEGISLNQISNVHATREIGECT